MSSEIRTNLLKSRAGLSTVTLSDTGPVVTGIATFGVTTKIDGGNNVINVGTALTIGHTQGVQFHTQNLHSTGFEVNQVNVSGIASVGAAITMYGATGIISATKFLGDGSQLTGISGVTINNNADNRLITGSGSANTLEAESGLTFSSDRLILTNTSTPQIRINNDTSDGSSTRFVFGKATANNNFFNGAVAGDSCIGFPGDLLFGVGTSIKARIDSSGRVMIGTSVEGNAGSDDLTIATSGSTGITLRSGTSSNGNLYFSDGTSGDDEYRGSIQYQHASNKLIFATNAVERLTIDSSGNILLSKGTQNTLMSNTSDGSDNQSIFVGGGGGPSDTRGAYIWAKGNEYTTTGGYLQLNAGNIGTAPITFSTSGSERARITSGGKLLIGATSGSNHYISGGSDTLNTVFQTNLGGAGATCAIRIKMNTSANNGLQIQQNGSGTSIAGGAHCASIINRENAPLRLGANNTEYFRIESNGHVYAQSQFTVKGELNMHSATTTAKYMDIGFQNNSFNMRRTNASDGGHSNFITVNASKVVSGNFNDTSDGKLKKNVATISDGAIEDIKKLRPVTFDWIDETENNNVSGFIAQEVKQVLPNLVDGTEYDPAYNDESLGSKGGIKSVGYSINSVGVTAHLTKAVQELIAKVEKLEQENIALRIRLTNLEDN